MPLLQPSAFSPPRLLRAASLQTILPFLFRRVADPGFQREVLELPDGDFLELDWLRAGSRHLAIVNHGLEGSTASGYVRRMATALHSAGYDVLAWNMRGSGTERNRLKSWYHSGQSDDLRHVLSRAMLQHKGIIVLVGFSVGGNILLKYLGEEGTNVSPQIRSAVAISVPLDLAGSAAELAKPKNAIYMSHLLRGLRARILEKAARFPGQFDTTGLEQIRDFHEFDSRFTAPQHGFFSVEHYWKECSAHRFLDKISIPTLGLSALDDPFLSLGCFPTEKAQASRHFFLETPQHGGHIGFIKGFNLRPTWMNERTLEFFAPYLVEQSSHTLRAWA